jgi:hypothetical protein
VSESLYHRFARLIALYGAVAVEELTVRLVREPETTGLLWSRGVPKTVLVAGDDQANCSRRPRLPAAGRAVHQRQAHLTKARELYYPAPHPASSRPNPET